jgi:hypothetical protein
MLGKQMFRSNKLYKSSCSCTVPWAQAQTQKKNVQTYNFQNTIHLKFESISGNPYSNFKTWVKIQAFGFELKGGSNIEMKHSSRIIKKYFNKQTKKV